MPNFEAKARVASGIASHLSAPTTMVPGFVSKFDYRPAAMIERLDLVKTIYRRTTNDGHLGKPCLTWEQ